MEMLLATSCCIIFTNCQSGNKCKDLRQLAMLNFLYSTGCRISEMCNANLSDLDMENHTIKILGKGNKWNIVYLSPRCTMTLRKYLLTRSDNDESLFVTQRAPHRVIRKGVEKEFRELSDKCGFGFDITPHTLRRSMATHCIAKGMTVAEVQKILNHSNINTTMTYAHINVDDLKNTYLRCSA